MLLLMELRVSLNDKGEKQLRTISGRAGWLGAGPIQIYANEEKRKAFLRSRAGWLVVWQVSLHYL